MNNKLVDTKRFLIDALIDVGNYVFYVVVKNTNRGINSFNVPFLPYSLRYQVYRANRGLGLFPNMQKTSAMMQSIQVDLNGIEDLALRIRPTGTDRNGIGNASKMQSLEGRKNYTILKESPFLIGIAKKRLEKYIKTNWR